MTSVFPEEIMIDILSRLPVKSIKRFRCVCKHWCSQFSNPTFVKMHLNHHSTIRKDNLTLLVNSDCNLYTIELYDSSSSSTSCDIEAVKIDYPLIYPDHDSHDEVFEDDEIYPLITSDDGIEILGSCNGLICFTSCDNPIFLWNPSTKEHKKIGDGRGESEYFKCSMRVPYGFGYGAKIDDYKVVSIFYDFGAGSEVEVYSLGSDSWKTLEKIPYIAYAGNDRPAVLVNECLHWLASPCNKSNGFKATNGSEVIVSFNINDETFKEMSQPKTVVDRFDKNLGVLSECLCLVSPDRDCSCPEYVDVWVMKEYGVSDSWSKMFTITQETLGTWFRDLRLIESFSNGEVLVETSAEDSKSLVLYDPKNEKARVLNIRGTSEGNDSESHDSEGQDSEGHDSKGCEWFEIENYVGSLVSLQSTELDSKESEWSETESDVGSIGSLESTELGSEESEWSETEQYVGGLVSPDSRELKKKSMKRKAIENIGLEKNKKR